MLEGTKISMEELGKHVNGLQLPRYQCHKSVWALKIRSVEIHPEIRLSGVVQHKGYAVISFEDGNYSPITWDIEFPGTSKPDAGWYYVVYEDGYRSFSPAASFETGYSFVSTEDSASSNTAQLQQPKITGYRNLSDEEISLMNQIKAAGVTLGNLIDKLQGLSTIDQRWLSIGKTDLQKGLMAVTRAVAQPTTF